MLADYGPGDECTTHDVIRRHRARVGSRLRSTSHAAMVAAVHEPTTDLEGTPASRAGEILDGSEDGAGPIEEEDDFRPLVLPGAGYAGSDGVVRIIKASLIDTGAATGCIDAASAADAQARGCKVKWHKSEARSISAVGNVQVLMLGQCEMPIVIFD